MSGQLDLSFSHQDGSDVGELPVVVDVIDASLEAAVKPRLVRLASGWRQDLEPGTYLVRVRFPSGKEIQRTCTVRDGDHIPISVDVRGLSAHESLERSAALRPLVRDESTPGLAGTRFALAWVRRWSGEASREWQPIDFGETTVSRDDYAIRYRFASGQRSNVLQLGGPRIAWRFISLPAAPVVDVTVSPRGNNDLAVEVTTDSVEAEALLGYLRTGAVEGADVTAESLLQQKLRDPIAAAIGGYYLLRTANIDRLSEWGPNLSQWFPWLPDGAVINGWQHIHSGREQRGNPDRHFDAARGQLIRAARRGVPVYTEGLRLLVDGLRLLREDAEAEDAELDAALTFIEPFAMAADWSAATVTYSGANPAEPNPRGRYGIPKDRDRLVLLRPEDSGDAAPVASVAAEAANSNEARTEWINFFDTNFHRVVRFVMHSGASLENAQDAAQEAFSESWGLLSSDPGRWQAITGKEAWIRMVALRRYRRQQETRRHSVEPESAAHDLPIPGPGHEELTVQVQLVLQALRALDEEARTVMALYLDGIPTADIADSLGITQQRVQVVLKKARGTLKRELAGNVTPQMETSTSANDDAHFGEMVDSELDHFLAAANRELLTEI